MIFVLLVEPKHPHLQLLRLHLSPASLLTGIALLVSTEVLMDAIADVDLRILIARLLNRNKKLSDVVLKMFAKEESVFHLHQRLRQHFHRIFLQPGLALYHTMHP